MKITNLNANPHLGLARWTLTFKFARTSTLETKTITLIPWKPLSKLTLATP